ncbi:hypothetical protein [Alicyclobacillus kakegawensis]|uniref:hypothetical protein n=1 Tax=Alicyclobacillus kakegawensis TaxID=392012 RepID=UPI0012ED46DA|nr:hypothetical protein [Alicyclobacillus kakegawensis]
MKQSKVICGLVSCIASIGLLTATASAEPAPPLTSFTFYAGTSDGAGYVWDYYYPYGDPTPHVAAQPMTGTTGYFALFEDGSGDDTTIQLSYEGNTLTSFIAADDTPLTDSAGIVWGWIAYRGFTLNQVPQNSLDTIFTSCRSLVFPYNTYYDYIDVDINPSTNTSTAPQTSAVISNSNESTNDPTMDAYNLLSIVADIRIHELDHETVKQPTINYNQFAELLDKNEMVRSSHKTTVPSYLVKSAQLIGQKYGKSIGDKVLADLVKAYKLGLVDTNDRLLTNTELTQSITA